MDQLKKKYEQAGAGEAICLGEISPEAFFKAIGSSPESRCAAGLSQVVEPRDDVNHPAHYATNGPTCPHCGSNIECITITERMGFCLGNTVKYIWRKDAKGSALEDLKKARWYLDREISKLEAE